MVKSDTGVIEKIATYYTDKLAQFGNTAQGVDWNGKESQHVRFAQLAKIIPEEADNFSIADLGCGYGAFFDYLKPLRNPFKYYGYDISEEMCLASSKRMLNTHSAKIQCMAEINTSADYGVASGLFNVRLDTDDDIWFEYICSTLSNMDDWCTKGFSFNCLTAYSDTDKKKDYLYYSDPTRLFDFCKQQFSKNVALLHDYKLYEFTILVRKL